MTLNGRTDYFSEPGNLLRDGLDTRHIWADVLGKLASKVTARIEKVGGRIVPSDSIEGLNVNGMVNLFFRVARWIPEEKDHYSPRWMIQRRRLPDGLIVATRLGSRNDSINDYLLVPTTGTDRNTIRFSEKDCARLGIVRFETSDALVRSIGRRVTKSSHVSPTKPERRNRLSRSNQPKSKNGGVPH